MTDEKKTPDLAPAPGSPEERSLLKGLSRAGALLGLLLVVAALVVALVRQDFGGVWVWVPLGLGVALLAAFVALNPREIAAALSGRTGSGAANTATTALAVLVLWFGVNYFANRFDHTWRVSQSPLDSVSETTRKKVGGLTKEVQIVALQHHPDLDPLLRTYARLAKKKLVLRHVLAERDPKAYEKLLEDLKLEEAKPDSKDLIVACGERSKVIPVRDLYTPPSRWRPYWEVSEDIETKITSAILSVSEETRTRVRFSAGHGERDPENYAADGLARFSGLLERDNYDVEKLPTLGPSILEECDVLVIAGAVRRFADHELELLSEYLRKRKGGKLLVLFEPGAETGLEGLLSEWGIEVNQDRVIEPNPDLQWGRLGPEALYCSPSPGHPVTASLAGMGYLVTVYRARTLRARPQQGQAQPYGAVPILGGSRTAYGETDLELLKRSAKSFQDETDNPPVLGVALERQAPKGMPGMPTPPPDPKVPDTRIVALGDADLASEILLGRNSPNGDLMLNAVRWLAAKEQHLGIAKRPRRRERIESLSNQKARALIFLVVVGLPLLSVLLGGLIWWVRRR